MENMSGKIQKQKRKCMHINLFNKNECFCINKFDFT
jgi:hypothetical protein